LEARSQGQLRIVAAALLAVALIAVLLGCGSSGGDSTTTKASFAGAVARKPTPPPPLPLRNYDGTALDTQSLHGKATLVLFIYTHCPDICPLMVSHLHAAQDELGNGAKKMQIIAVSVDPKGDTPKTVASFLNDHQMTGRMKYLIGSRPQLERVWRDWNIVSRSDPRSGNPDFVEHSAEIYGISGSGKVTTLYPANFKPRQIVHDVPLLASS
jgi:protein SCO1